MRERNYTRFSKNASHVQSYRICGISAGSSMKISGPRAVVHWESNRIPARHHQIQRPGTSGDGAIIKYEVLIL